MQRDHGGNPDTARACYGGAPHEWLDLSTGINRRPYPLPQIPPAAFQSLPTREAIEACTKAAQDAYRTRAATLALPGAQAAIQLIPRLQPAARVAILAPTYNEHAASFRNAGWTVSEVQSIEQLRGATAAVVVNPNNPDGQRHTPEALVDIAASVDLLVVDESFCDLTPDTSLCPDLPVPGVIVLRSFGKFYGHAGLRLGFAIGEGPTIDRLADLAGPWPVNGPALHVATTALADRAWATETSAQLSRDADRLDTLAEETGWSLVGGTHLFRTYQTPNAAAAQDHLARHHIWSRIFPYSATWLRLGLPGPEQEWAQLTRALRSPSRPA